ncbi:OmpA/MotB domain protein [Geobacter metallireducens RCH3]|uniref:Peptidoglycan-binding lipoprotein, OmpA family n=1 Tax=Geobacter metallireducens (strain ATCC 53774 / DSM 7210 / GS-15) TaxID=269799 RepID=Q39SK2_GEOMG|nr:OmpA family protein [Geobacter metallireducens]ABB32772.1 peptidoglycan-binding lipoprotein, OmpA family [Geobacter metallireducens GS-15]EHP86118.1 OmpA/MotB domain protein [Geobacter metallireducens RCH3]
MAKRIVILMLLAFTSLSLSGCLVAESTYLKKAEEADTLGREAATLQEMHQKLSAENGALKAQLAKVREEAAGLAKEKEKLGADNKELEQVLRAKTDTLSQSVADLRQKVTDLETENTRLKAEIAETRKAREEKVREVSKTYEDLLDRMKGEIAQGQVTISELKGKLTVNMVDAILFDSGKAEVKQGGMEVLAKVVDILKGVQDKMIRIEGHTDNVQIVGNLTKRFPTNWELSAARAINVARYLQGQGIDPTVLVAVANGEYRPVASNDTEEGRAKNRRIEIVLVPRDAPDRP